MQRAITDLTTPIPRSADTDSLDEWWLISEAVGLPVTVGYNRGTTLTPGPPSPLSQ